MSVMSEHGGVHVIERGLGLLCGFGQRCDHGMFDDAKPRSVG
jgi:hypothetical protein